MKKDGADINLPVFFVRRRSARKLDYTAEHIMRQTSVQCSGSLMNRESAT